MGGGVDIYSLPITTLGYPPLIIRNTIVPLSIAHHIIAVNTTPPQICQSSTLPSTVGGVKWKVPTAICSIGVTLNSV